MMFSTVKEPAQTDWTASTLFACKKDAFFLCVNHSRLSARAKKDVYSNPSIGKCFKLLGEASVLLTLDVNSG